MNHGESIKDRRIRIEKALKSGDYSSIQEDIGQLMTKIKDSISKYESLNGSIPALIAATIKSVEDDYYETRLKKLVFYKYLDENGWRVYRDFSEIELGDGVTIKVKEGKNTYHLSYTLIEECEGNYVAQPNNYVDGKLAPSSIISVTIKNFHSGVKRVRKPNVGNFFFFFS